MLTFCTSLHLMFTVFLVLVLEQDITMEYQTKAAVPSDLMDKEELLVMLFFQFKIYHGEEEFILTKTSTSQRMVAT